MKKLLALFLWFPITLATLIFSLSYYNYHQFQTQLIQNQNIPISHIPYKLYSSIPKVLGAKTVDIYHIQSDDINYQIVYDYLKKFNSPMLESSENLVSIAQEYKIDPLLLVSIAQCESNLGKKMPHEGEDKYACHNPFGWGIHQNGTLCFNTWEDGYQAISKGLSEKYYAQGYQTTEEIMTKYTPPALEKNGSWAKCVNYFLKKINETQKNYPI